MTDTEEGACLISWHFDIQKPEGERRLRECLDAPDVKGALSEFDNELRRRWKYGEDEAQMMTVEQVRGLLWATLKRWKVDLDDD